MIVTLSPDRARWLESQVASGLYGSIEEAVRSMIGERMSLALDDPAWARPLVDEGREALRRGDVMTVEEHRARNATRLTKLRI